MLFGMIGEATNLVCGFTVAAMWFRPTQLKLFLLFKYAARNRSDRANLAARCQEIFLIDHLRPHGIHLIAGVVTGHQDKEQSLLYINRCLVQYICIVHNHKSLDD